MKVILGTIALSIQNDNGAVTDIPIFMARKDALVVKGTPAITIDPTALPAGAPLPSSIITFHAGDQCLKVKLTDITNKATWVDTDGDATDLKDAMTEIQTWLNV